MSGTAVPDLGAHPVALVSGANKGIGFAIVRGLAQAGHVVLLGARDPGRGEAAAAALSGPGAAVHATPLDVTDDASIAAAIADITDNYGRLDVLVNNAGVALDRQIEATSLRQVLQRTFEVNVFGLACLTEAAIPLLARAPHPRVVNMASTLGSLTLHSDPASEFAQFRLRAYNASKAAVSMLTVTYAARLHGTGIKVNAACPGYVASDMTDHRGERTTAQGAAIALRLATLDDAGPSGGFYNDAGAVPW